MTQEEKAKRYDEALERAKGIHRFSSDLAEIKRMEYIFPELAESEDERIRKEFCKDIWTYIPNEKAHKYIAWLEKQGEKKSKWSEEDERIRKALVCHISKISTEIPVGALHRINGVDIPDILAWLEKQREQKEYTFKSLPRLLDMIEPTSKAKAYCQKLIDTLVKEGYSTDAKIVGEYLKQMNGEKVAMATMDEQKPADKAEPKFKVGDWIVYNNDICQIVKREEGCNKLVTVFGIEKELVNERNLSTARLWSIADAKDGDVLCYKGCVFIFKKTKPSDIVTNIKNPLTVLGYCGINRIGFEKSNGWGDTANCKYYPATKEQSDLLFLKMEEAEYEWDNEKKELRKIEKQSEQKLNNVKPKFHEGEWIVNNDTGDVFQVTEIKDDEYCLWPLDGEIMGYLRIIDVDNEYHLWTIQDAQDGDVLVSRTPFIYGKQYPYGGLNWYNNKFIKASNFIFSDSPVHPATKEQRDLLFSKMKEAGYEWDAEKKELKKMESKKVRIKEATGTLKEMLDNIDPIELEETRKEMLEVDGFDTELNALLKKYEHIPKEEVAECLSFYLKVVQSKSKWTDEDDKTFIDCCNVMHRSDYSKEKILEIVNWIKSLKQRIIK